MKAACHQSMVQRRVSLDANGNRILLQAALRRPLRILDRQPHKPAVSNIESDARDHAEGEDGAGYVAR